MNATVMTPAAGPGSRPRRAWLRARWQVCRWVCDRAGWIANNLQDVADIFTSLECRAALAAKGEKPVDWAAEGRRIEAWRAEVSRDHDCPAPGPVSLFQYGRYLAPTPGAAGASDDEREPCGLRPERTSTAVLQCRGCGQEWQLDSPPAEAGERA